VLIATRLLVIMSDASQAIKSKSSDELKWLELVIQHVGSLRYGVVEIVVHDSRVIQIEKTERVRLDKNSNAPTREP
jgi:hypothetical protein